MYFIKVAIFPKTKWINEWHSFTCLLISLNICLKRRCLDFIVSTFSLFATHVMWTLKTPPHIWERNSEKTNTSPINIVLTLPIASPGPTPNTHRGSGRRPHLELEMQSNLAVEKAVSQWGGVGRKWMKEILMGRLHFQWHRNRAEISMLKFILIVLTCP